MQRYTPITLHPRAPLYNIIIIVDTVLTQKRNFKHEKQLNQQYRHIKKGDKSICDNHRGISLLCIAGKILTRILLNRLSLHLADNVLPESQCGSPGTGEVQRAKPRSVHGVCRPDESFRHNQQRWFMADTTKDWLPGLVCRHHTVIPPRDGGPSTRSRTNVRVILGNKWYQARLCDGTTVIHISILSHDQWCIPWQWLRSTHSVPNWWKCI